MRITGMTIETGSRQRSTLSTRDPTVFSISLRIRRPIPGEPDPPPDQRQGIHNRSSRAGYPPTGSNAAA